MSLDLLSTKEAAAQLGVTARRVRALIKQGDLDAVRAGRTLLIEPESVARHQARGRAPTRPLSPRMSWAALLSEIGTTDVERVSKAFGLSSSERGRLMNLRRRPTADWTWLARRRAHTHRYAVRPAYLADVVSTSGVVPSGISALDYYNVNLTTRANTAEVYAQAHVVETLAREFALRADAAGNLIVHVLPEIDAVMQFLEGRTTMPSATVAIDLLEAGESRARRAGLELLDHLLD
ncbi:MAG: helix-turn-helix domain-containing protein [Ilumatobacteraceae bacterium]